MTSLTSPLMAFGTRGKPSFRWLHSVLLLLSFGSILLSGCAGDSQQEVVVYAALDREFSEPILQDFEDATGIRVLPKFDTEANKTVGLASAILQERNRPRCDLFWNNEILQTLLLEREGVLDVYRSPGAKDFPPAFVSKDGHWHGFAARARVLIVNTKVVPADQFPSSVADLADPKWRKKTALARPLFGTSATHAAVLFATWGDEKAKRFYADLRTNEVNVVAGNKQVAEGVGSGQFAFGLTDTDDAILERDRGSPVAIVFPDQREGELGSLLIPNTLALVRGSPHAAEARRLVDFLLRPPVEVRLAEGESGQFPLNPAVKAKSRVMENRMPGEKPIRWIEPDFSLAAEKWPAVSKFLTSEFLP